MTGRRGEHVVASFLCSQGWHPVIADAEGYDIIATKGTHILCIQIKSCSGPIIGKRERAPGFYRWTVGLGRHKKILIPTDHYDVLALVALGRDVITFVDAKDVNKKTYRAKPEALSERATEDTWRRIVANL